MAFSDPIDAQCSDVLRDVWAFLDDELDPDARAAVQRHLDECSPCLDEAGLDAKLKHILQAKCGGERAPEHLRVRLVARIATISAALRGDDATVHIVAETVTLSRRIERTDPS